MLEDSQSRLRILLVDDDEEEFILAQSLLMDRSVRAGETRQTTYKLEWVATFDEALAAFERDEHDVYLVDYNLGSRTGLELLQQEAAKNCQAPIILMTGQGSYDVDLQAMREGATDYLDKSGLNADLLERAIRYSIERKRTEEAIRKQAARSELLASLTQAFAGAGLAYSSVVETIARQVATSSGDVCTIRLLTEDGVYLDPIAYHHPDPETLVQVQKLLEGQRQRKTEGLAGAVFTKGEARLIESPGDISNPEDLLPWVGGSLQMKSALVIPLRSQRKLIGTLALIRIIDSGPYTQADLSFYKDLADRAALAIENARLYASEAQRARELDALNRATNALLTTLELDSLLRQILDAAQSALTQAKWAQLYLVAPDTGKLQLRAATGQTDPRIRMTTIRSSSPFVQRVLHEKKPLLYQDVIRLPGETMTHEEPILRSGVAAPLKQGNAVHGVIVLGSPSEAAFSSEHLRLLQTFADTTTAAIQNAMLHAEVQKLAVTDTLTDFYNRRGFAEMGKREIERAVRFARPLSLIMVDIDAFKDVNDTYGHMIGDQVLRNFADRIRSSVREVDIIGRYGGDEYIIVLPEADLFMACHVAERVRANLEKPIHISNGMGMETEIVTTASLGVANMVPDSQDLEALIERADNAAYQAKQKGRNRVEIA